MGVPSLPLMTNLDDIDPFGGSEEGPQKPQNVTENICRKCSDDESLEKINLYYRGIGGVHANSEYRKAKQREAQEAKRSFDNVDVFGDEIVEKAHPVPYVGSEEEENAKRVAMYVTFGFGARPSNVDTSRAHAFARKQKAADAALDPFGTVPSANEEPSRKKAQSGAAYQTHTGSSSSQTLHRDISLDEAIKTHNQKVTAARSDATTPRSMFGFSDALSDLKSGHRVCRQGWNGKGMWLVLVEAKQWSTTIFNAPFQSDPAPRLLPWIAMKTADNSLVPWLASQTDILAMDWMSVP